jgi:predicted HTH domain antitoxin
MFRGSPNADDNVRAADGALSALRLSPTEFVKEMRVAAALLWYSQGELSQSKAAEIAGTSRAEFIDENGRGEHAVIDDQAHLK